MLLREIAAASEDVAREASRLRKIGRLADVLRRLPPGEIPAGVAFLSGEARQGRIGLGYAAVSAAPPPEAERASLTVADADRALGKIAAMSGPGAGAGRVAAFRDLLARATAAEQGFLRRLVLGELRQGAQEGVVIDALAKASGVARSDVQRAWMVAGDPGAVAAAALLRGAPGLEEFRTRLFQPLRPMLAQAAAGPGEALERLGRAGFEFKLDGARIQVHRAGGDVRVFTRSLHDVTAAVPEVVEAARALPGREAVLDGEAVAFGPDGRPEPFQVTMRRFGRRLDVAALRGTLPLTPVFFDLLRLDGRDLIERPAAERVAALRELLPPGGAIARIETGDRGEAEAFLRRSLEAGHEGVVAKALGSPYEAGRRGAQWLKVKPAHTLDLVVLAAEWGSGRRQGTLGNIHLGARDPRRGFVMLGKTFKGMTDEMLRWQTRRFLELEIRREGPVVLVRPEQVVEVAFDGVQASSQYPGGVALRFARVKRYRTDKTAAEADTLDMVKAFRR